MGTDQFSFRTGALFGLLAPAFAYLAWQRYLPAVTAAGDTVDGSIGVVLGLLICSRPAQNGIDVLFFERGALRRALAGAAGLAWLLLNALVMLVGWFVIVVGAMRITSRPM